MSNKSLFIKEGDDIAIEAFRRLHNNTDLMVSTCLYNTSEPSTQKIFDLRFHLSSEDSEKTRTSTLEACYYINEYFDIPQDCIEIIYTGGCDGLDAGSAADSGGESANNAADTNSTTAETVILIPPIVFAGQPMPIMPAINYELAQRLVEDVTENIDIDVYHRDYLIRLPNSINSQTNRYVIPLTFKELLYMTAQTISKLSKQPRPEDSMIQPSRIPEAVEWFMEVHTEFEKKQHRQNELRKLVLKNGWQIPSCIRRLIWADLDRSTAMEACRLISGTYSFLGSHEEEIQYHILRLARRNDITGFEEHLKLKAIVTFGVENPILAECQHPLMARFCPSGGCFIAELITEYEKPFLFQQM
jgi:hypothetical protein